MPLWYFLKFFSFFFLTFRFEYSIIIFLRMGSVFKLKEAGVKKRRGSKIESRYDQSAGSRESECKGQYFAWDITELFTYNHRLPFDVKLDTACRLTCKEMGATSVAVFIYSGKDDRLHCRGRYIDPEMIELKEGANPALKDILQNICLYEFLYSAVHEFKINKKSLYGEYKKYKFRRKEIGKEKFLGLIKDFSGWKSDYEIFKNVLRKEWYGIDGTTITGDFYHTILGKGEQYISKASVVELETLEPSKKKKCINYLERKLKIKFEASHYVALPLFANDRYSGVLRFLFPQKMDFIEEKDGELCLNDEYLKHFRYLAQIISLHLESFYLSIGYKKIYLSSKKYLKKGEKVKHFLNKHCESLSEIIESRGAIIRRWDKESDSYEIVGYSDTLKDYVKSTVKQEEAFYKKISRKFEEEKNIIGVHSNFKEYSTDYRFTVTKYIEYEEVERLWHKLDKWEIKELSDSKILDELEKSGLYNVAIMPIPGIPKTFITFLNSENRVFLNRDIKMIYPALRNLGLELKSIEYIQGIEQRLNIISKMHDDIAALFTSKELKGYEYVKEFIEIVSETIKNFGIFSYHIFWEYVSEIVPERFADKERYFFRNITRIEQEGNPFKSPAGLTSRNFIYKLPDVQKELPIEKYFSDTVLDYFNRGTLKQIFPFRLKQGYSFFDLPFYGELKRGQKHPPLVGVLTLVYKEDEGDQIENEDFFRCMRFFSRQLSVAWKTLQENIAIKIQEEIDNQVRYSKLEKVDQKESELTTISGIVAEQFGCYLCCFFLANWQQQTISLAASNIPIEKGITYSLKKDTHVLSVASYNQNKNFRVFGRKRVKDIADAAKIEAIEEEIKPEILKRFKKERKHSYKEICIEHWQSVVINIGESKLGLIKLFRIKGLRHPEDPDRFSYKTPPFSEFETNLLERIQKHIFNIIFARQTIQKRMEDMRNVLHQVIAPLNALMAHSVNISEGIVPPDKVPERLHYIRVLSKISANYARNFQRILDIDTRDIKLKKVKINNLKHYLDSYARDYQPLIKSKNIFIHVTDQTKEDISIYLDRDLFSHVITNLLDNAVKYSFYEEERLRIGLQGRPESPEDPENVLISAVENEETVEITISNWGLEISEEYKKNIFSRGFRGGKAEDRVPVGDGIGLFLVNEIVILHGGRIELVPNTHKNNIVFRIILPKGGVNA